MTVFISFSSGDRKIAEKVYDRLTAKGVKSWISTRDIPAGADYQACIVEAIERASLVVLVFSSRANASPEIAKELSLASRKILIPARIEDVVPQGSFQYQLSNRQFVDLFEDFDQRLDELVLRVKAVVDGSPDLSVSATPKSKKARRVFLIAGSILGLTILGGGTYAALRAASSLQPNSLVPSPAVQVPAFKAAAVPSGNPPERTAQVNSLPASISSTAASESRVQTATPIQAARSAHSDRANLILVLLGGLQNYERARALEASAGQLPDLISVSEAEAILKGTNNSRTSAIAILASHLPVLPAKDVVRILSGIANYDRLTALDHLLRSKKIRRDLDPSEAKDILDGLNNSRTSGISGLASLLQPNLNGPGSAQVLGDSANYERLKAIESLTKADRIQKALPAEQAKLLLDATNNSRSGAIQLLAPFLQEKMDGRSVSSVLGSTTNYDRFLALSYLVKAGRVNNALGPDEVEGVLTGIGNSRGEAVKLLISPPAR